MDGSAHGGRVLVGYDGRWQSPRVLDIAANEAVRRACPLAIATLVRAPEDPAAFLGRPADGWNPRTVVRRTLDEAARYVRLRHPDLRVTTHCVYFGDVDPAEEPFASASLLVLGQRHAYRPDDAFYSRASQVLREATAADVVLIMDAEQEAVV